MRHRGKIPAVDSQPSSPFAQSYLGQTEGEAINTPRP
jgi:hypothetical protein